MNMPLIIVLVLWTAILYRVWMVHEYRIDVIRKISAATNDDISQNREWRWRYIEFYSVSYNKMMLQFWRPLDSFYADKSFMKIGTTGPSK